MRFPPSFLERLRAHFLISEVIGKRIALKKHGREYHALCPFHNEKSPSFTVNDEKGFYHCFGCAAHGDAIGFVMRHERMTYPEAVERLARDAGIPLPEPTPEESRRYEQEKTLFDVLEEAAKWFEQQLASPAGSRAREYVEKRGLKPETIQQFRIGYAPDDRTALHRHLAKAGFSQPLQAEAGLIIQPEDGPAYDRFRGRVMFPIRNPSGKVIAFGGRLLGGENAHAPKYLNSPETPLFKKGETLYNLDLAKRPAREGNIVAVMEGYMDVVATSQAGVAYAVATLGTAVTPVHLRLLWQLAREPVICLDGDAAGRRAMLRAAEIALPLLKPEYSLRFALLPQGEDPDTYVQKHGRASFEKILSHATLLSQAVWENLRQAHPAQITTPESFAALKSACQRTAAAIADPIVREEYRLSFERHLYECQRQLQKKLRGRPDAGIPRAPQVAQMMAADAAAPLDALAWRLFGILFKSPELLHQGQKDEALLRLDLRDPRLNALRQLLCDDADWTGRVAADIAALLMQEAEKLRLEDAAQAEQAWQDTIAAYEIGHLERELDLVQASLGEAMDEAAYQRLVELKQALDAARAARRFAPKEEDAA